MSKNYSELTSELDENKKIDELIKKFKDYERTSGEYYLNFVENLKKSDFFPVTFSNANVKKVVKLLNFFIAKKNECSQNDFYLSKVDAINHIINHILNLGIPHISIKHGKTIADQGKVFDNYPENIADFLFERCYNFNQEINLNSFERYLKNKTLSEYENGIFKIDNFSQLIEIIKKEQTKKEIYSSDQAYKNLISTKFLLSKITSNKCTSKDPLVLQFSQIINKVGKKESIGSSDLQSLLKPFSHQEQIVISKIIFVHAISAFNSQAINLLLKTGLVQVDNEMSLFWNEVNDNVDHRDLSLKDDKDIALTKYMFTGEYSTNEILILPLGETSTNLTDNELGGDLAPE